MAHSTMSTTAGPENIREAMNAVQLEETANEEYAISADQSTISALTPHQPKNFMDLATETRLQIYGHLFGVKRCSGRINYVDQHCCSCGNDTLALDDDERLGMNTCSPVSTAILRSCKQAYEEALPVLWESVEFMVKIDYGRADMKRAIKIKEEIAKSVRRMVIAIPGKEGPHFISGFSKTAISQFDTLCDVIGKHRPKLSDLRVHVDSDCFRVSEDRIQEATKALRPAITPLDNITLYIDLHANSRPHEETVSMMMAFETALVEALQSEAGAMGKSIAVRSWKGV